MKTYFFDTSFIVNYLRDKKNAVETFTRLSGDISSSYICLAELYEGIYRVQNKKKHEDEVINFFYGLDRIFGLDYDIAHYFGQLRAELKQDGRIIEDIDIFIGATCLVNNLILVTYNPNHFKHIRNILILTPA